MRKSTFLAAAAAVVVSTLPLASCQKQSPTTSASLTARLATAYEVVEGRSMTKTDDTRHAAIVEAVASLNPEALRIKVRAQGSSTIVSEFDTGDDLILHFGKYTFFTDYRPESMVYLNDSYQAASDPFFAVSFTEEVTEGSTELIVPATYNCYALVAPAAQCSKFRLTPSNTELPSVVVGEFRITFLTGNFPNNVLVTALPSSDDYVYRQIAPPSTPASAGKYYYLELPPTGTELESSLTLPEWAEGAI